MRRRDRRGRGLRGTVLPMSTPGYRTRAERFDDLVLDAVEDLERRWARQLEGAEFAVEDVPPSNPAPWEHGGVPLGRYFPADAGLPHETPQALRQRLLDTFDRAAATGSVPRALLR